MGIESVEKPGWAGYTLAAFSGAGLALSFPDYHIWPLAWFSVAPFLVCLIRLEPWHGARLGLVFGLFYFGPTHTWLSNTMINFGGMPVWLAYLTTFLGALYVSFFTAFFGWMIAWAGRKAGPGPAFALAPMLWVSVETLRGHMPPLAFPWARIADSQYLFLPAIQIADIGGAEAVGFVMLLTNTALAVIGRWAITGKGPFPKEWAAVMILTLAATFAYGHLRLRQFDTGQEKKLTAALLQGNIDQARKWSPEYQREQMRMYLAMTLKAASDGADLVVWPETGAPYFFGKHEYFDGQMKNVAQVSGVPILFGAPDYEVIEGREVSYNSAWLLTPGGKAEKFDKMKLAPFGEYVPLPKLLFFVRRIAHAIGDLTPGKELKTLDTKDLRLGPQICFEIIFPEDSARLTAMGANVIVTITNDSWFGYSAASTQSLSMAVFRAVENRIPLLRAAQSGVSAVVDPSGRITANSPLFVQTALFGKFTPRSGPPGFYSRYVLWVELFFPFMSLAGLALIFRQGQAGFAGKPDLE